MQAVDHCIDIRDSHSLALGNEFGTAWNCLWWQLDEELLLIDIQNAIRHGYASMGLC